MCIHSYTVFGTGNFTIESAAIAEKISVPKNFVEVIPPPSKTRRFFSHLVRWEIDAPRGASNGD